MSSQQPESIGDGIDNPIRAFNASAFAGDMQPDAV